jgi:hypothetical protein
MVVSKKIAVMKRVLLAFLVFCSILSNAQLVDAWKIASDLMTYDRKQVYECPNGNMLLARMDDYYGIGTGDDQLLCYSPDGAVLWSFGESDFSDNSDNNYIDIDFDSESNVYIAGTNFPINASYPKTEVIKLSPLGEELWRINFTQQATWAEEVFEIEITSEDRIFLLAILYNGNADTIIPHFIEIDQDGQTVTLIPDNDYDFGLSQLFDFDDGFLYAVEGTRAVKLNYDGSVVWQADFNFGENYSSSFGYENTENLVQFRDGKLYCALRIDDSTGIEQYFGLAEVSADGQAETHVFTILTEMPELFNLNPHFLELNENGDFYLVGDYVYGESGPTIDGVDDRGGKGSSFRGAFVHKINASYTQSWIVDYPEMVEEPSYYPVGTFIQNDGLGVVFQGSLYDGVEQVTVYYDEANGSPIWTHVESANEVNDQSNPKVCLISAEGALYVCGDAFYSTEESIQYNIYLYKYFFTPVGVVEKSIVESMQLYPNPADDQITIRINGRFQTFELIDISGKTLIREGYSGPLKTFNIEQLSAGVYFVRLIGESTVVESFMKK